jgi:hypothetical protein
MNNINNIVEKLIKLAWGGITDPYKELGFTRGDKIPLELLNQRRRELVKKYHPDLHTGLTPEQTETYKKKLQDANISYDMIKKDIDRGVTYKEPSYQSPKPKQPVEKKQSDKKEQYRNNPVYEYAMAYIKLLYNKTDMRYDTVEMLREGIFNLLEDLMKNWDYEAKSHDLDKTEFPTTGVYKNTARDWKKKIRNVIDFEVSNLKNQ